MNVAEEQGTSLGSHQANLTEDFGMRRVSVKLLTVEERRTVHLQTMICSNMQKQTKISLKIL
jgi:hypothetical protein